MFTENVFDDSHIFTSYLKIHIFSQIQILTVCIKSFNHLLKGLPSAKKLFLIFLAELWGCFTPNCNFSTFFPLNSITDPELEIDFEDGLTLYEAFEFYLIELISEISMFSFDPSMVSFVQISFSVFFEFFSSLIF